MQANSMKKSCVHCMPFVAYHCAASFQCLHQAEGHSGGLQQQQQQQQQ
jgi:hypothetical protein